MLHDIIETERRKFEQETKNYQDYIDSINAYGYFLDLMAYYSQNDPERYEHLLRMYTDRLQGKMAEMREQNLKKAKESETNNKSIITQVYQKLPLLDYELGRKEYPNIYFEQNDTQPLLPYKTNNNKTPMELIAKRYSIEITKEEFIHFKSTMIPSENIINFFGQYLEERSCFGSEHRTFVVLKLRLFCFPIDFYRILSKNQLLTTSELDYELANNCLKNANIFQDCDHIIIPLTVSRNQYNLVWVNLVELTFSYLDPVNSKYNNDKDASKNIVLRNVARFIAKMYTRKYRKKFEIEKWKFLYQKSSEVNVYQETGIFICYFMFMIFKGFNSFTPSRDIVIAFFSKLLTLINQINLSKASLGMLEPGLIL